MKRKWLYSEKLLSEVSGISRTELVRFRKKYVPKSEWRKSKKGKGGSIELSEAAVLRIKSRFGIEDANLDGARTIGSSGKLRARETDDSTLSSTSTLPVSIVQFQSRHEDFDRSSIGLTDTLKLLHVSQLVPNNRILKAQNGTGEVYNVIVGSSLVWALGDPLRAKVSQNHQGYYDQVGRAPRWRGDRLYRMEFV